MSNQIPVQTKPVDYAALVRKVLGKEYNEKDVAYQFSNGREFDSTDGDINSGLYPK